MRLDLSSDDGDTQTTDFARRLAEAVGATPPESDVYGLGGAVTCFEDRFAAALGKERAILMPTGTLANLLAVRAHATVRHARRVVAQAESHLLNDSGDGLTELASLMPRAIPHAVFTAARLADEIALARTARVAVPIAAVAVENPVRRLAGATGDLDEQRRICALAAEHGIATHLDGARLYIAAGFSNRTVRDLAAPYDSVYVSLYKYFGVPFGAMLAGPAILIDGLFHERRRFGGSLHHMWPAAVVADRALDGMEPLWRTIASAAHSTMGSLRARGLDIAVPDGGTNVFRIPVAPGTAAAVVARASALDVRLPIPAGDLFEIKANASWLAQAGEVLVDWLMLIFRGDGSSRTATG